MVMLSKTMVLNMMRLFLLSSLLPLSEAFVCMKHPPPKYFFARYYALPTPEESAKALTDYMANAHEEKLKAMASIEAKYQDRIKELEGQVKQLEARSPIQSGTNSYEMPATNKQLAKMVGEYREFLQRYLVKSQQEKVQAVATAEQKIKANYESVIAELPTSSPVGSSKVFE